MRQCGECQLCCKLLPMKKDRYEESRVLEISAAMIEAGIPASTFDGMIPDFDKPHGERCPHQRHHKGCSIYRNRPWGCRIWNCRWLVNDDTNDLKRPDRSHLVIDIMPDFVTLRNKDDGSTQEVQVVQVWIDPDFPDAHREPRFRAYVERRAKQGIWTLIRRSRASGFTLVAPRIAEDRQWHEEEGEAFER
ncbi:MAG TPA: YkgJ family cysteine cluster protein [Pirellulales bacterium]|nr:YkgJ family cysteine cluster protein [Pirellulales bacterium]